MVAYRLDDHVSRARDLTVGSLFISSILTDDIELYDLEVLSGAQS